MPQRILVVGGYGQVGKQIASRVAESIPGETIIAGRNINAARAVAATLGDRVLPMALDISRPSAATLLDGLTAVVVCVDQDNTEFASACLSRGIHYVDITATRAFLKQVEELDHLAWRCGATALLSVGVAPGLTNLLAAEAKRLMPTAEKLDILVELGLGDQHGRAAIEWMLENTGTAMETAGSPQRVVRSFDEKRHLRFPKQKSRAAYLFNFPEAGTLPRTLEVPSVATWLRFSSSVATWVVATLVRLGATVILRRPLLRRALISILMRAHIGAQTCGVAVRAESPGGETLELGVLGQNEARMTATIAAESIRQLLLGEMPFGAFHSDEVVELAPVLRALDDEVSDLQISIPKVAERVTRIDQRGHTSSSM